MLLERFFPSFLWEFDIIELGQMGVGVRWARATQQFIKLTFISKQAQGPIDMRNRLSQLILKQRVPEGKYE